MPKSLIVNSLVHPGHSPHDTAAEYKLREYTGGIDFWNFRARVLSNVVDFVKKDSGFDDFDLVHIDQISPEKLIERLVSPGYIKTYLPGSLHGVHDKFEPIENLKISLEKVLWSVRAPIVGKCLGAQMMAVLYGGKINTMPALRRGYLEVIQGDKTESVWVNHRDKIDPNPDNTIVTQRDSNGMPYAFEYPNGDVGYLYHPERLSV